MSQKIIHILQYSIINIFYGCMVYFGVIKDVVLISNIFMFLSWIMLIIISFSLCVVILFNILLKSNRVSFEIQRDYYKKLILVLFL